MYYDYDGDNMREDKNKSGIVYRLIFVPYMGDEDYSFSVLERDSLEEIDNYTSKFNNFEDLVFYMCRNMRQQVDISRCYVRKFGRKVGSKMISYNVLYSGDVYDEDYVKLKYKEYCLANPDYFKKYSPANVVNVVRDDYYNECSYINRCLMAWFNKDRKDAYRRVRGAYFELKKLGVIKNKSDKNNYVEALEMCRGIDSGNYFYYFEDEEYSHLSYLLGNDPNWDEISKLPEEIKKKIMFVERGNFNGKGRRLR